MNLHILGNFFYCLFVIFFGVCDSNPKADNMKQQKETYSKKRHEMVDQQIAARGVSEKKLLTAMRKVPRHEFVADKYKMMAYDDSPQLIGHGQTISQPYIVAYMTEMLKLTDLDTVLEIGTGSGYQAAVLAELAAHVYTIEIIEELGLQAEKVIKSLGYDNITVKIGDGYQGWIEFAPFDIIILTASPKKIPQPLINQLKNGGRLIAPVGDKFQELILITRIGDDYKRKKLIPVRFVPMTGAAQEKK